jgi:N-acetylmuramoyl-L-alanine amidase
VLQYIKQVFLLLAFITMAFSTNQADAAEVKNIRFGKSGDATRIVIDSVGPLKYEIGTLAGPPRIVLDLPGSTKINERHQQDPSKRIKAVRFGRPHNLARIVFDLKHPAKIITELMLQPGPASNYHRLVLDLDNANSMGNTVNIATAAPAASRRTSGGASSATSSYKQNARFDLPTPRPPALERKARKKHLIMLDPGHGGQDPGGIGKNGVREKDIVLSLARTLKQQLEATGRYEVRLTRNTDHYVQLRERFRIARAANAELFISLHADKIHIPSVRGASVYTLSETSSDAETARLAQQANNAGVIAGVDLGEEDAEVADILLDLVRRESLNESKLFADLLVVSMGDHNIRALNNTHRFAGFAVLKAPDIPSVLIEAGFISNAHDARLLQKHDYQLGLSNSIRHAVDTFFNRIERLERG